MSEFEDRLFADLMREHGADLAGIRRPAPRRGVPRPVWVTAGAVGVLALGIGLAGTGTPAYAVTHGADGTITVSVWKISGVAGANAELRKLGVPAVAVPMRADCTASLSPDVHARMVFTGSRTRGSDSTSDTVTFAPSGIPAGDTLILAAKEWPDGVVSLRTDITRGPAPACLPARPVH
jgi:hypothetical protein